MTVIIPIGMHKGAEIKKMSTPIGIRWWAERGGVLSIRRGSIHVGRGLVFSTGAYSYRQRVFFSTGAYSCGQRVFFSTEREFIWAWELGSLATLDMRTISRYAEGFSLPASLKIRRDWPKHRLSGGQGAIRGGWLVAIAAKKGSGKTVSTPIGMRGRGDG